MTTTNDKTNTDGSDRVSSGYKAIQVNKQDPEQTRLKPSLEEDIDGRDDQPVEVNLEDITDGISEDADNQEDVNTSDDNDDNTTTTEEKPKNKQKKETSPKPKRKSRAQERIKQLHSEKTEADLRAQKAEERIALLEKQLNEGTKSSKTSVKETLENSLKTITHSLREAMENGDTDDAVRLNEELINTKMQLAAVSAELMNIEKDGEALKEREIQNKQKPKQNTDQQSQEIPEKALDWIEEHPQFNPNNKEDFDEMFYTMAIMTNNQMINEGFDPNEDDFYEELNERLSPRFPEIFGIVDKNNVSYEEDTNNASEEGDEKDTSSNANKQQTVSGASRTPPHKKGSKGRGKDSVVLDPQAVKQAQRWGLSLEQVARRVAHQEKNKRSDGYVPIQIK